MEPRQKPHCLTYPVIALDEKLTNQYLAQSALSPSINSFAVFMDQKKE